MEVARKQEMVRGAQLLLESKNGHHTHSKLEEKRWW